MTCEELLILRENYQFEAKSAQGQNSNGEIPKDLWESYSAMANTDGGKILLGAKELKDGSLKLFGKEYVKLDKDERLALILSFVDGEVANARLSDIGAIHPADSSKILKKLVERKLLISEGVGRGTKYYINKSFNNTAGTTPSETVGIPSEPENLILNYIQANGLIRREDVEKLLNVKESRAREILRNMSHDGKITKINSGKNTYYEENR